MRMLNLNLRKVSMIVVALVVLYFLFRYTRGRMSFMSADMQVEDIQKLENKEQKKEAVKAFLDANKLKLKESKFNIVARFNVLTEDKQVLQNVMDAAKVPDYNKLIEILNSL